MFFLNSRESIKKTSNMLNIIISTDLSFRVEEPTSKCRKITISDDTGDIQVNIWAPNHITNINQGDTVAIWDARVSHYYSTPSLDTTAGTEIQVCQFNIFA